MKISRRTPRQSPTNLGCSCVGITAWWCFKTIFSFFCPLFKPLKISFKTMITPPERDLDGSPPSLCVSGHTKSRNVLPHYLWMRSFGMTRKRITWIMEHQRNRWILAQSGFSGSFDEPWSEWSQITDPLSDHISTLCATLVPGDWNYELYHPKGTYPAYYPA